MAKQITSSVLDSVENLPLTPDSLAVQMAETASLDVGLEVAPEPKSVQVDSVAAEAFISEKRIGERIKFLRLKKSMGLVELGRHTGLSASFLSQLETGRVVPTLRNLARIAMVFSKDLSYFFDPEPQTLFRVHRKKDRMRLPQTGVDEPSYFFESLGYQVPDRQLDPYYAEFLPAKAGREPRAHQHIGCEFLYLLSGTLSVRHADATHTLEPGDAVYFDANTIHSYLCTSDESANAVIVTLQNTPSMHLGHGRVQSGGSRVRNINTNGSATTRPVVDGQIASMGLAKKSVTRTQ